MNEQNCIVTIVGGQPVTTSLVIAEGVEHEHRAVLKIVRDYLPDFEDFGRVAFEVQPFATAGGTQQREVAILNEHHATLLITFMRNIGPVKDFKKRLVKAFWDMARQLTQPAVPQTLPEALRLAADLAEGKAKAEAALAIAAPKAAALDRIAVETEGAVCLRVAAKLAQVPEKQFLSFLRGEGWIFRHHHSNTWQGYGDKEKAGLLELKRTRVTRDDGSEKTVEQVLVTPRGQAKAAELIERKAPWLRKVDALPPRRLNGSSGATPA